jgi:hypothetical protein
MRTVTTVHSDNLGNLGSELNDLEMLKNSKTLLQTLLRNTKNFEISTMQDIQILLC